MFAVMNIIISILSIARERKKNCNRNNWTKFRTFLDNWNDLELNDKNYDFRSQVLGVWRSSTLIMIFLLKLRIQLLILYNECMTVEKFVYYNGITKSFSMYLSKPLIEKTSLDLWWWQPTITNAEFFSLRAMIADFVVVVVGKTEDVLNARNN